MTGAQRSTFGPVQMLVVGFDGTARDGEILAELKRLNEAGVVRLIDLLVVTKNEDGELDRLQVSDLTTEEAEQFGAIVGALIGLGAGGDDEEVTLAAVAGAAELEDGHVFGDTETWYVGDALEPGTTAAIALLDHQWAIPLREKIVARDGVLLADAWIHPADLVAVGLLAADKGAAPIGAS